MLSNQLLLESFIERKKNQKGRRDWAKREKKKEWKKEENQKKKEKSPNPWTGTKTCASDT